MTRELEDAGEQTIAEAYYDDEITYAHLIGLVGMEAASNYYDLKRQMDEDYFEESARDLTG